MKFRKKPIEVEAVQFDGSMSSVQEISRMAGKRKIIMDIAHQWLVIKTLEGPMKAMKDDWIIKGVKGEVYPCNPEIFELTYEPI